MPSCFWGRPNPRRKAEQCGRLSVLFRGRALDSADSGIRHAPEFGDELSDQPSLELVSFDCPPICFGGLVSDRISERESLPRISKGVFQGFQFFSSQI